MTASLLAAFLATAPALSGDDVFTAILNGAGYEIREKPCESGPEIATVAIFADGRVKLNGTDKDPAAVAMFFDQNWVQVRSYCLYMESPWSKPERDAYHLVMSGVTRHDFGVSRFIDPEFTKQAVPKNFSGAPTGK